MILKIGNPKEWYFLDKIESITIIQEELEKVCVTMTVFIASSDKDEETFERYAIINRSNNVNGDAVGEVYKLRANQMYLLSDEGKTIERIFN